MKSRRGGVPGGAEERIPGHVCRPQGSSISINEMKIEIHGGISPPGRTSRANCKQKVPLCAICSIIVSLRVSGDGIGENKIETSKFPLHLPRSIGDETVVAIITGHFKHGGALSPELANRIFLFSTTPLADTCTLCPGEGTLSRNFN